MFGTVKTINVLQTALCPHCNGHKFINGSICTKCNGTGEHAKYSKLTVKVPAGIKNKSKIRLAGEGESGKNGGHNGDLYLIINIIEPHEKNIDDINIYKTISITPFEAVLGSEIKIQTPNNEIKMIVPANTQNGQKFSLSGCGNVQNEKIGDMIITVEIKIPKNLTKEEISLYKKLRDISSSNIRDTDYDR
jgi:DnaJ-class molecular chaperone